MKGLMRRSMAVLAMTGFLVGTGPVAAGAQVADPVPEVATPVGPPSPVVVVQSVSLPPSGYRLTALDGGVFAFGQSTYRGSANTVPGLAAPIIDIDETFDRAGYWQVGVDGGVFAWGAPYFGSAAGLPLNGPILGIAARPQGDGYWLVGLDGGVFAFGGAPFLGSAANVDGAVIVEIVATGTGNGYWLLDAGGTVHAFGDAVHAGNYDARDVEAVGLAMFDPAGYWIANVAGNVLPFGSAPFLGQVPNPESLNGSVTGIESLRHGRGYWLVATDGGIFAFGDAPFYGSLGGVDLVAPVVAIAGVR
jgi:hypothetical protein